MNGLLLCSGQKIIISKSKVHILFQPHTQKICKATDGGHQMQKRTWGGEVNRERRSERGPSASPGDAKAQAQERPSWTTLSARRIHRADATSSSIDEAGYVHSVMSGNMQFPLHFPCEISIEVKMVISPRTLILSDFISIT